MSEEKHDCGCGCVLCVEKRAFEKGQENGLSALALDCNRIARNHGFWPKEGRNDGELVALMHSEASELLEALRYGNPPSVHIPQFSLAEEECADIVIRVLDFAYARHYDIAGAIKAKVEFNRGREFKHGKAF